jgi:hypothetical protein
MADLAETGEVADGIDNVVRGLALRLVNDESAVEGDGLWFAGHLEEAISDRKSSASG